MSERSPKAPPTGGGSLLVVFAVLCLVTFAMLGLASVQADRRMYRSIAAMPEAYYEADVEANRILAAIRSGTVPEGVERDEDEYAWQVPVTDVLSLCCEARIQGPDFEIRKWALDRSVPWEGDFDMDVMDADVFLD